MRALALSAVFGIGLFAWMACTGSDPSPAAPAQGSRGQRCFDDGSCLPGLGCDAGTCAVATAGEGGAPSPTPEPTGDAAPAGDAGVDAPPPCVPWYDGGAATVRCGDGACVHEDVCCRTNDAISCVGTDGCADEDVVWACETKTDCLFGSSLCCITGTPTKGASCPAALDNAVGRCVEAPTCADAGHDFVACESSDECATGHCGLMEVHTTGGFTIIQQVCQP